MGRIERVTMVELLSSTEDNHGIGGIEGVTMMGLENSRQEMMGLKELRERKPGLEDLR